MAAKRRKSVSEEPSAKRQKLKTNIKSAALLKKKKGNSGEYVVSKLKPKKGSKPKTKAQNASVKPTALIKKSHRESARKSVQTKDTFHSKQIVLDFKHTKRKSVETVDVKPTVQKSSKLSPSSTAVQISRGSRNTVTKSSEDNIPGITRSTSRASFTQTGSTTRASQIPSHLKSTTREKKALQYTTSLESASSSVQISVKSLNNTQLRILHLGNTSARIDSIRNRSFHVSAEMTFYPEAFHNNNKKNERNEGKLKERLDNDAVCELPIHSETHKAEKKHSGENHIKSRTALYRNPNSDVIVDDNTGGRNTKPPLKSNAGKNNASERKLVEDGSKLKPVSQHEEPQDRRSERLHTLSSLLQKGGMKEVSQVMKKRRPTKDLLHTVKIGKHAVSSKKGKAKELIPRSSVQPRKLKNMPERTQKLKGIKHNVLKCSRSTVSRIKPELSSDVDHGKCVSKSKRSSKQNIYEDSLQILRTPASQDFSREFKKSLKEKSKSTLNVEPKPQKLKVKQTEKMLTEIVTEKVLEEKLAENMFEKKSTKQILAEKMLTEKVLKGKRKMQKGKSKGKIQKGKLKEEKMLKEQPDKKIEKGILEEMLNGKLTEKVIEEKLTEKMMNEKASMQILVEMVEKPMEPMPVEKPMEQILEEKLIEKVLKRKTKNAKQLQLSFQKERNLKKKLKEEKPKENLKKTPIEKIKKAKEKTTGKLKASGILKAKVTTKKAVPSKQNRTLKNDTTTIVESVCSPETDSKSKRVSILALCEEIAGEIESDTVEVRKEIPDVVCASETAKSATEPLQQVEAETVQVAEDLVKQIPPTKCFFPSKKFPKNISPTIKHCKPKEIKPMKSNHATRHNALNFATLPNLEFIRNNVLILSNKTRSSTSDIDAIGTGTGSLVTARRLLTNQNKDSCQTDNSPRQEELCLQHVRLKEVLKTPGQFLGVQPVEYRIPLLDTREETGLQEIVTTEAPCDPHRSLKRASENGILEPSLDESFSLRLDSSPEDSPKKVKKEPCPAKQAKLDIGDWNLEETIQVPPMPFLIPDQAPEEVHKRETSINHFPQTITTALPSDETLQNEIKTLKESQKDGDSQLVIDAGQKRFGAISCNVCGMLYTASNPEDETQHILFHNQFVSAVKYVGWKKERILAEFPDGKIIMVFPDDPKYALKKVQEIREMVDNDLGFQQVPLRLHARTKTLLFISNEKKIVGCLIAEHIQWGYRVIDEKITGNKSEREKAIFESQKAWCCSTSPEPALCGISRIWVFRMMRRQKIASRMIECLRSNFIYGWYLAKEEIAFSDPTPDGKQFATHYCATGRFLVYNFISGQSATS